MGSFDILLFCIYMPAVFFFIRFIYVRAFKSAAKRSAFVQSLFRTAVFIPAGIQGVFIFSYAAWQPFAVCMSFNNYFIDGFYPMKIILAGSLLLTVNVSAAKAAQANHEGAGIFYKVLAIAFGVTLTAALIGNMKYELSLHSSAAPVVSYSSDFLLLLCGTAILFFSFFRGRQIYETPSGLIKYLSLASRVLLLYSAIMLLLVLLLPRVYGQIL